MIHWSMERTECRKGKRKAKEDEQEPEEDQDLGGNTTSPEEIEHETDGLERIEPRIEEEMKKTEVEKIESGTEEIGMDAEENQMESPDLIGPDGEDILARKRPPVSSSRIETDIHQDDIGSPRTGDAGEIGADCELEPTRDEEKISSENGGRHSLETKGKGKEDYQANVTSFVEDLQGKATTEVEAGPSSTQKGSHLPPEERSPVPPTPPPIIEVDRNQDIEGPNAVEYGLSNASTDPDPPRPSLEGLRENDPPKAEDKGKKADDETKKIKEDAFKSRGAVDIRRTRRRMPRQDRSGLIIARSKRGSSRTR
jgi:hypothetical protein